MILLAAGLVIGVIAGYYAAGHYSVAAVKEEVAKLEAEGLADAKAILARIKAAL
jgi:hypothetical protein